MGSNDQSILWFALAILITEMLIIDWSLWHDQGREYAQVMGSLDMV